MSAGREKSLKASNTPAPYYIKNKIKNPPLPLIRGGGWGVG